MEKLTKKQKRDVDKIIEMSCLLTPTKGLERLFGVMEIDLIDCTPSSKNKKKSPNIESKFHLSTNRRQMKLKSK